MTSIKSKSAPDFEPMAGTETTTETTTQTTTQTTTEKETAMNTNSTAVAASTGSTAVGAVAGKFQVAFAEKNNVFDTATVEGLSLAAPRIKGEQGSCFMGDKDLGDEIKFELISFNHRWAIGSGEDDKEAKDFFRVSYDNVHISGEDTLVKDYVESLKAQGFTKAKVSPYMDLFGFVVWTKKDGDVAVEDRQICCLQCSQTSLGAFTAFCTTRGLLESRGVAKPLDVIGVRAMKRTSGTNKYTNFEFFAPKS